MLTGIRPKGTVAERLRSLRAEIGLTRKEVERHHKINMQSLISWEKGHRIPKKDKAQLLAAVFNNYGIPCTVEWILDGDGKNPIDVAAQNPEESYLLQEIYRFQEFHKDSLILEVKDQNMAPWIRKGDFVGGVLIDLKETDKFVGQVCIAKTQDFGTLIRLVEKTKDGAYDLVSFSKRGNISNVELESVARIVFLRRK